MKSRLYQRAKQENRNQSSWTFREAITIRIWEVVWFAFARFTPKMFNRWRLLLLKIFGAKVVGCPFVFPSAKIYAPFNLEIYDGACIGPNVNVYNLGKVVLNEKSVLSQAVMLCGGTHDLSVVSMPLLVGDIIVGENVFIGARATILPGVELGDSAVVGACSLVTKDVDNLAVVGGNPAKFIKKRELRND